MGKHEVQNLDCSRLVWTLFKDLELLMDFKGNTPHLQEHLRLLKTIAANQQRVNGDTWSQRIDIDLYGLQSTTMNY